ncbi:MAG: ABC transporter substrate-binding protein [Rhodospirillaceae bacterium]|nr:ABC transporter substrate-binding protein [Rhodospirillaceae bacterium]
MKRRDFLLTTLGAGLVLGARSAFADFIGSPYFAGAEAQGDLPPVAERLPRNPAVARMLEQGKLGGELRMLMANPKDTRVLVAYSYARLVCYDTEYKLQPDICASFDVQEGRIFTFKLREGHKWSDGKPFTSEAFRYFWEDVANNEELMPTGIPTTLKVDGQAPTVEFPDDLTVRYSWDKPNPDFLPAIAGASPLYIFRPGHYLKKYHKKYRDEAELKTEVEESGQPSWAALHNRKDNQYRNDNPKLPTLDPWTLRNKPPAERFIFTRNPYYYRVDEKGQQLPYFDQVVFDIRDSKLIPAKAAAGETDLQARYLRFDSYTILKEAEERDHKYVVRLWDDARGSNFAIYPNLTTTNETWRKLFRDVRCRRALSLAIDRNEINQAIYFGLGVPGANTVLQQSPLYKPEYTTAWSEQDLDKANALLDEMGLTQRSDDGLRLLPNGEKMVIVIDTAGESTEETDILQLVRDSWRKIGVDLFSKPSEREVFRNRVFSGESIMSVFFGIDNGVPNADLSPWEFCPSTQQQLQWAKWGQFIETSGEAGEKIDLPEAQHLFDLLQSWRAATDGGVRAGIWDEVLNIWSDQVFSIGTVANVPQPVVVGQHLHNVPEKAIWAFDPGAHFGVYKPDTFWTDSDRPLSPIPE